MDKQNKDKTIRVQPIASFFGGTPGGAVKCIVRRRTGAPTKVVQHPDVDDIELGLDVESEVIEAECEGEEGERHKYMNAKSSTVTEHSKKGTKHQSRDVRSIEVAAAAAQPPEAVQQHFAHDAWSNEGKHTLLQMRVLINLMQHGRPMTAYKQEKAVFKELVDAKVINQDYMSSANWSDDAGWELLSYMARHVVKLELARVRDAAFFAVSGDEATSRDKLSYFSLTAYIMVNWERVPTVLDVPRIDDAPNAKTLTEMLIKAIGLAGIDADAMRERLMSVAFDGAPVMQGEFSGVATRVRTESPFHPRDVCRLSTPRRPPTDPGPKHRY
ncbi:hypothetical protein FOA52_005483 [Chlamydomonas sp. UWO 241]|nr:hypothetical protein FOA52_005483 [Chlamydomonas sp. UWO 241]